MSVFVDTSALLAIIDADEFHHPAAKAAWNELITSDETLVCTNYVLIETFALLQSRLGLKAARLFQEDIVPVLTIDWVDDLSHAAGTTAWLTAGRGKLSLVDCVSFESMRRLGIKTALTLDRHFKEQGFECLPK
ncbi:MAG: PIN domain-containing protein [Actinomycetota bacterium]|nr:PIN domain-containing protein [Actinomycetota bacterium]